jgi:hypothetical protein
VNNDKRPDDESQEIQEVVSEFDGIQLRSSFRVVEEGEGQVSFEIQPPLFEFLDDLGDGEPEDIDVEDES